METPDLTKAQKIAGLIAGIPLIVNFLSAIGMFELSNEGQEALEEMLTWAVAFASGLTIADAGIRIGRANMLKSPVPGVAVQIANDDGDTSISEEEPTGTEGRGMPPGLDPQA